MKTIIFAALIVSSVFAFDKDKFKSDAEKIRNSISAMSERDGKEFIPNEKIWITDCLKRSDIQCEERMSKFIEKFDIIEIENTTKEAEIRDARQFIKDFDCYSLNGIYKALCLLNKG